MLLDFVDFSLQTAAQGSQLRRVCGDDGRLLQLVLQIRQSLHRIVASLLAVDQPLFAVC